ILKYGYRTCAQGRIPETSQYDSPDHHPACHRRYGCYCPTSFLGLARFPLPTHRLHGRRPCLLEGLLSCIPRAPAIALALSVGEDDFAGGRDVETCRISWRTRRIPCQRCRAPRNTGGTREVCRTCGVVVVCEGQILPPSIPRPSGSGAVRGGRRHGVWICKSGTRWWGNNFVSGVQSRRPSHPQNLCRPVPFSMPDSCRPKPRNSAYFGVSPDVAFAFSNRYPWLPP
ncbi:hypothetical protein B0H13DRAFT_2458275, partial [Mycena leptocephala]